MYCKCLPFKRGVDQFYLSLVGIAPSKVRSQTWYTAIEPQPSPSSSLLNMPAPMLSLPCAIASSPCAIASSPIPLDSSSVLSTLRVPKSSLLPLSALPSSSILVPPASDPSPQHSHPSLLPAQKLRLEAASTSTSVPSSSMESAALVTSQRLRRGGSFAVATATPPVSVDAVVPAVGNTMSSSALISSTAACEHIASKTNVAVVALALTDSYAAVRKASKMKRGGEKVAAVESSLMPVGPVHVPAPKPPRALFATVQRLLINAKVAHFDYESMRDQ